MGFERWLTGLASGLYNDFGDTDEVFPYVYGKWGCLFLLRIAQAPQHLELIAAASEIQPDKFLWRLSHGFEALLWDVRHDVDVRKRAISAAPALIEACCEAAKNDGGAYMFWDNAVALRGLHAQPRDEEQMVEAVRAAIEETLRSGNANVRAGADHGMYHLESNT